MKAALLTSPYQFQLTDLPDAAPVENEVLVRVRRAGICGSDLHFYEHGTTGGAVLKEPFVMGHEFCGVVEDTNGVKNAPPAGTRVAVDPSVHCGTCPYCRMGRFNICPNVRFTGFPPYSGAYTDLISIPAGCLFPIPDSIPDELGPVLETLAVAIHSVDLTPDVKGRTCLVIGAGTVGLLVLIMLLHRGANVVGVIEPVKERREKAQAIGCESVFHPHDEDAIAKRFESVCPYGPDFIFEAAGMPDSFQQSFDLVAPGGKVGIIGIYAQGSFPIDFSHIRRKEAEVVFVRRSLPRNYPEAIQLVSEKMIDISPLVTHTFPLHDVSRAFDLASRRTDGIIKAVLTI